MINIVLCGGSGTRLWPVSQEQSPKQFCNLIGATSPFQETLLRNKGICSKHIVVTNTSHYNFAKSQSEEMSVGNVEYILEPIGRNTAPAITLACLDLDEEDIVLVTPSDHYIKHINNYKDIITRANELAEAGFLVIFGIKPSYPETGYGYIEADMEHVISFHEKPNSDTAKDYVTSGNYFWNSGMFAFKVKVFLDEMKKYSESILTACIDAFENRALDKDSIIIKQEYMKLIPKNSIDYAVIEKSKKLKFILADIGWSDLGSFESIYEASEKDSNGNVSTSSAFFFDSNNNLVMAEEKSIILIDVDDLIVAHNGDAILISKKGSSHKIKNATMQRNAEFYDS